MTIQCDDAVSTVTFKVPEQVQRDFDSWALAWMKDAKGVSRPIFKHRTQPDTWAEVQIVSGGIRPVATTTIPTPVPSQRVSLPPIIEEVTEQQTVYIPAKSEAPVAAAQEPAAIFVQPQPAAKPTAPVAAKPSQPSIFYRAPSSAKPQVASTTSVQPSAAAPTTRQTRSTQPARDMWPVYVFAGTAVAILVAAVILTD